MKLKYKKEELIPKLSISSLGVAGTATATIGSVEEERYLKSNCLRS